MITLAALVLLSTVFKIQAADAPQQISVTVAEVGGNVTLQCAASLEDKQFFQWQKQVPGFMIQTVAAGVYDKVSLKGEFNNPRFHVKKLGDMYSLTIRNLSKEDEASYFCLTGTTYSVNVVNTTFLAVNDLNQQKPLYVKQIPETQSVQLGDVMNLTCSLLFKDKENVSKCPDEHSAHWFRAGNSHPTMIYTYKNRSDKQEERSCFYSLSKTIQDSSDAGTYYCAVVTCGQILIGDGTKVETIAVPGSKLDVTNIVLGCLLACCLMVNAGLIICLNRGHYKGSMSASHNPGHDKSVDQSTDLDGDADAVNYVALDFSSRRKNRGKKKKRESPEECLYSAVKSNYHTSH